jgi:hypothetical protein
VDRWGGIHHALPTRGDYSGRKLSSGKIARDTSRMIIDYKEQGRI